MDTASVANETRLLSEVVKGLERLKKGSIINIILIVIFTAITALALGSIFSISIRCLCVPS